MMELHISKNISKEKLTCAECNGPLSYFPIRMCSNKNICGRCNAPTGTEEQIFRNIAYETLSQFLHFPCCFQNEGCEEELLPKDVPLHEENCGFRIIPCPTNKFSGCEWRGPRTAMLSHCQAEHQQNFLTNFVTTVDYLETDPSHLLLVHDNLLLIFKRQFDNYKKVLIFEMYTTEFELNVKKYSCQLTASSDNKSLSIKFTSTSFSEVSPNELSLESVIGNNSLVLKLTIEGVVEDPSVTINFEMLALLKCFICSNYAMPPIYYCVHSTNPLCSDCKMTHETKCTFCSQGNNFTRNINLDKVACLLNYPCKNQSNGCTHISKPEQMKKHQLICELGDFDCPVKEFVSCSWRGPLKGLENHIQSTHQELVSNSSQLTKELTAQVMKCDIIKFANQLFRLVTVKTQDENYYWTVQMIGVPRDNFRYEIEILDPSEKGKKLLVRQQCGALTSRMQLFQKADKFCYFMKDQIKDFIVHNSITFKVHIFV